MAAAEPAGAVYDDFRFVTRADLATLELDHLIGTSLVRAYMHGFFIDNRLYHKAKARVEPFAYDAYRAKRVEAKVEAARQSRISMARPCSLCAHGCATCALNHVACAPHTAPPVPHRIACAARRPVELALGSAGTNIAMVWWLQVRKLPKVNAEEHMRLQAASMAAAEASRKSTAADGAAAEALLADERFKAMFEDDEFAIDPTSRTFRELHPNAGMPVKCNAMLAAMPGQC
jgi:ribosome biogenesis protein ENP2